MRNYWSFAALLLISLCCASAIRWTNVDDSGNRYFRSIRVVRSPSVTANTFEIRGVKKQIGVRNIDVLDFLFSTEVVPRYVLRYFSRDDDGSELFMNRWSLWKVFEYEDSGANDGFNPDTDNITSSYILFNRRWTTMTYHKEEQDGATLHYLCTDLNPVGSNPFPNVRLCSYFTEKQRQANATTVHPNALKWSITIDNYPYTSNSSRLGLKVSFDGRALVRDLADTDASAEDQTNEAALDVSEDTDNENKPRGVASWVTTVTVDDAPRCAATSNVVRSVIREAGGFTRDIDTYPADPDKVTDAAFKLRVSYFSFPTNCANPKSLTWDPEFGVALEDEDSSAGMKGISVLLVALLLFASLLL